MKRITTLILAAIFTLSASAQDVPYEVIEDNPENVYTNYLAVGLGTDFDWDIHSPSAIVSVFGRWGIQDKIYLEGVFSPNVYQYQGKGFGFLIEGGIFYSLKKETQNRKAVMRLSKKYIPENADEETETAYKNLKIPAKFNFNYGARGGLILKTAGYESPDVNPVGQEIISHMTIGGIYLGGEFTSALFLKTNINDKEHLKSSFLKVYGDLNLYPYRSIEDAFLEKANLRNRIYGFRVGIQYYFDPYADKNKKFGSSILFFEVGDRPLIAGYTMLGWGFTFLRY